MLSHLTISRLARLALPALAAGLSVLALLWLVSGNLPTVHAATLEVCPVGCPFVTIQAAVNGATSGDVISIHAGTYYENVTITNKVLTFAGAGAGATIVDGGGIDRGFNSTADLTLQDLTVQNGFCPVQYDCQGGGLYTRGNLALRNVSFYSNTSTYVGGGAYVGGTLTASGARFENNVAMIGGGLYAAGDLALTNSQFIGNAANQPGGAGGAGVRAEAGVTLSGGLFQDNTCAGTCWGGGMYEHGNNGTLNITGTRFIHNTASAGGGLFVAGATLSARVVNALLAGNQATGQGNALNLNSQGNIQVLNTTIDSGNPDMMDGAGIYVAGGTVNVADTILTNFGYGIQNAGGTVSGDYNLFYGNNTDTTPNVTGGANNQYGDPVFVNPTANDYHLSADSPAVDTGEDVGVTTDLDGNPRPRGAGFDIGAYELSCCQLTINPPDGNGVVAPPAGVYTYTYGQEVPLTATANLGARFSGWSGDLSGATDPITITMNGDKVVTATFGVNNPPVADAGVNQTVMSRARVTLDGSASYDPDGDAPLTYHWAQTGGPAVTLSSPAVSQPTFTAPVVVAQSGVLTFTLVVTDSWGMPSLSPAQVVITVTPSLLAQTITFDALPDRLLSDSPFAITATATSGLAVSFVTTSATVCSVSGNTVTLLGAGACAITAQQAGNANYAPAPDVTQSFTAASKLAQAITFDALPGRLMSDSPVVITATASSGLQVSFSTTSTACSLGGYLLHVGYPVNLLSAGECVLVAQQAGNDVYNPAPDVTQTFTISKVAQTITFAALPDRLITDPSFGLTATASSGLPVTFTTSSPACTVQYNPLIGWFAMPVSAGDCAVTASQAGNNVYNAAPDVTQTFTISKVAQTITFAALPGSSATDPSFGLTATASSGLPVNFTASSPACTVQYNALIGWFATPVRGGDCAITASQPGNDVYNPAPDVTQTLTISKADQSITFAPLPDRPLTDASFVVTPTASSGLPVGLYATSTGICSISGHTVTLLTYGACSITTWQPGNDVYNAAPMVARTFTILKPWTLMFYLNGDNSLDMYVREYFNQIEASANNPAVNIVAVWDQTVTTPYRHTSAAYYHVQYDSQMCCVASYTENVNRWSKGNLDMGNPQTLVDFGNWARSHYPAQHYALVLVDHGGGLGGAMQDDTSGHHMTVRQIGAALDSLTNYGASKVDVLYMYACLMGMVEDAYQWRNDVDYYVASEDVGWATDITSNWIFSDAIDWITPATTPRYLGTLFMSAYSSYAHTQSWTYTMSVADLSKLDGLVSAVNSLAEAINPLVSTEAANLANAGQAAQWYSHAPNVGNQGYVDLYDFARLAQQDFPDTSVKTAAQSVMDAVNAYVIGGMHSSGDDGSSHGVSIFFPSGASSFYNANNYDFAVGAVWSSSAGGAAIRAQEAGSWGAMLVHYFQVTQPNGPDNANPPPLVPLQVMYQVYLPLVRSR